MRPSLRTLAVGATLAVVALSCGGGDGGGEDGEGATSASATARPTATSSGRIAQTGSTGPAAAPTPAALDFSAATVDGGQLDVRAYAGSPVAFWFWAPY